MKYMFFGRKATAYFFIPALGSQDDIASIKTLLSSYRVRFAFDLKSNLVSVTYLKRRLDRGHIIYILEKGGYRPLDDSLKASLF